MYFGGGVATYLVSGILVVEPILMFDTVHFS